ncbi:viral A-type inclusion protein [Terrimonas alba]|uniref:viral A-type inclusion protein n=1 Tax=Terrimonas alba TaxID=3349636 RepID=UPI0035F2527E
MKHLFFVILFIVAAFFISCNDSENKKSGPAEAQPRTEAQILWKEVMDGHDIGMAKMGKLTRAEQATRRMIDSIEKLPAKAKQAAAPLKLKLDSLQKELSYAEFAMNKWMEEFNIDSAENDMKKRIEYLKSEKLKVSKVKESILTGLQKADSLLKDKF